MKEVTLKIPDNKVEFIIELIKQLGLEFSEEEDILEEHKRIVRERIRMSVGNPSRLIEWEKWK